MMQVEEKPDVTYSDVGGCKEQIEKLREVVETPLLSVRLPKRTLKYVHLEFSQNVLLNLASTLLKASSFLGHQEPEKLFVPVQLQTAPMLLSSV